MPERNEVGALSAIYAADRADSASIANMILNVLSMAIAYIAATIALLFGVDVSKVSAWVIALVPLPVALLSCHFFMLSASMAIRSTSIRRLESRLHERLGDPDLSATDIGAEVNEQVFNSFLAHGFTKILRVVPYAGVVLIVVSHIAIMLTRAWSLSQGKLAVTVGFLLYAFIAVIVAGAARELQRKLVSLSP